MTLLPGWSRLSHAAVLAAVEPATWAPLLGAAALQIGDADEDIADWASEKTPVFNSQSEASEASDFLKETAQWTAWTTAMLAPSGDGPAKWIPDKALGFGVEYLAGEANSQLTRVLKTRRSARGRIGRISKVFHPGMPPWRRRIPFLP